MRSGRKLRTIQSLVHGFYDGVGGFFYKPYKGARDEGVLGFAKGCGKGLTGIIYEPIYGKITSNLPLSDGNPTYAITGAFGVFGYTGDGISKSLDRAVHHKTMKNILAAKQSESEFVMQKYPVALDMAEIVKAFLQRRAAKTGTDVV